ncbi:MAG: YitT family protein [Ruminococcaceae bacterium]|nr:YitT family protein [Oscillospiraceae bacterium]
MKAQHRQLVSYGTVALVAILLALNYDLFIVENHFAPAGLNGIATMVQYKTGFSISYMSLLINIPLCLFAFFCIRREFALKTLLFTLVYSFSYLLLQQLDTTPFQYNAQGHDLIFPVIISGVISGFVYGICIKNNACTGGTDVVSRYISKVRPRMNFFRVTFLLNTLVAFLSLFVYSDGGTLDYKPVALCITYCFISNFVGNYILEGTKTAYKFTIITNHPQELSEEITQKLHHGITRLEAFGAYTNTEKTMLLCVVNKHQLTDVQQILNHYEDTFSFCELVSSTYGNFKHIKKPS